MRRMNESAVLTYGKCLELLSTGVVGRAAVCTPAGPRIVPVNYSVVEESIVFRTTPYSVLGTYAWNTRLAFEVDQVDVNLAEGVERRGHRARGHGRGPAGTGADPRDLGPEAVGEWNASALRPTALG